MAKPSRQCLQKGGKTQGAADFDRSCSVAAHSPDSVAKKSDLQTNRFVSSQFNRDSWVIRNRYESSSRLLSCIFRRRLVIIGCMRTEDAFPFFASRVDRTHMLASLHLPNRGDVTVFFVQVVGYFIILVHQSS